MARLALAAALAALLWAAGPPRPRILGISHVAFRVSDLAAARSFYEDLLGYRALPADGTAGVLVAVGGRQYVELIPGLDPAQDRLDHVALETDDARAMRRYLVSLAAGVPADVSGHRAGGEAFAVRDPEGHAVEFVQYRQAGRHGLEGSASPGLAPVSSRILHAGIIVGDLAAAASFYGDVLGFPETWRGSRSGTELSWVNVRVPDGSDYLEFMLYGQRPAPAARGTQHHICLEVPDVERARTVLAARPYRAGHSRPLEVRVGTNRKRQLNLFDPDGTRVELMEPDTVDGRPAPPSTAPPPGRP